MDHLIKTQAWDALFNDPELGAGNFLFKAHAAYGGSREDYLFLEKPFIGPRGNAYQSFSLDSLFHLVSDLAAWYRQQGIQAGRHVCLFLGDGIPSFLHFLALGSLGCVPVLINGHLRADIAALYAQRNRFDVFVYDKETDARWDLAGALRGLTALDAGFNAGAAVALAPLPASGWPAAVKDEDIVMVCHSSGTTGIPKAVLFGHAQFFNGKRERLRGFVEQDEDKLATAMPPTHAAGVSYLMTATMLQLPALALATQTGQVAANLIASFQPTIVTAFSQTYASFAELNLPDGYFDSVRRYYNTGDTAHEAHIRQLLRLAPRGRFTDMFGASELGMSQFFKVSTPEQVASKRTVGAAASYARCDVLTPQGELLPDGQPGYIGVRSPTVTPGYYGQPHLTALTTLNGYWLTGDIGLRLDNGEFVHLDRIVDAVPTPLGVPAYTLLLEEHLLSHADLFDVSVIGVSRGPTREEAVLVLARGKAGAALDADEVLRQALDCFPFKGRGALPDYTVCVGVLGDDYALPVGSTGKVLKRVERDQFWSWQRDYDDGLRDVFSALRWNQSLDRQPEAAAEPQSLLDYLRG
ncbi:class I adenylate-forming enzyme family protein [Chromobacterium haemolyticum]|uniref:class I adenylate-forming enzyme family protein n=1 Tax=Chromobacterium haemolyticum TaxID=394935 RepID=UPI0009DAFCE3|nr:class I adenylate-forming enzyme family protein [Chromobacterium haemolyticum]OQS34535.1 acyl-CoA synthetase [Chromobacterium haemolyticum]